MIIFKLEEKFIFYKLKYKFVSEYLNIIFVSFLTDLIYTIISSEGINFPYLRLKNLKLVLKYWVIN
jgi:hypothetical protein